MSDMMPCRFRRLIASFIDGVLSVIVTVPAGLLFFFVALALFKSEAGSMERIADKEHFVMNISSVPLSVRLFLVIMMLIPAAYYLLEVFGSATLGKRLLGVRIFTYGGGPAPIEQRLVRWAVKVSPLLLTAVGLLLTSSALLMASGLANFLVGIGGLLILGSASQTLWDRVAGTCVYLNDGSATPAPQPTPTQSSFARPPRPSAPDPNDLFKPRW